MPYDKVDIDSRTYDFALNVLSIVNNMPNSFAGRISTRQLARYRTSIGVNGEELRAAESRLDFTNTLLRALKEAAILTIG
ncbi:MAG: four helix bundle protein [Bacteriovoracaceae bacterium]